MLQLGLQLGLSESRQLLSCRRKLEDGQPQLSHQDAQTASADSSGKDRPALQSDDAQYLRDRKLQMDSLFAGAADS